MAKKDEDFLVLKPNGDIELELTNKTSAEKEANDSLIEYAKAGNHIDDCIATIWKKVATCTLETKIENV